MVALRPTIITSVTVKPTGTWLVAYRAVTTFRSMRAAARKRCIAVRFFRDLLARDGRGLAGREFVASPLGRARETMELVRAAIGLPSDGYHIEPQLAEIAFGDWEGFTIAQLHSRDPQRIAAREQDKWHFVPPGGESYQAVTARMGVWYENLTCDTVAVAHGGTARGLIAYLGIVKPAAAPLIDIEQGVVYVFEGDGLTRYS